MSSSDVELTAQLATNSFDIMAEIQCAAPRSSCHVDKEQIAKIVRKELKDIQMREDLFALLTGNTLENNIRTELQRMNETFSALAKSAAGTYLREHLEDKVTALLTRQLRDSLPLLVRAEMLERLSNMSGVDKLLEEHKRAVDEMLRSQEANFHAFCRQHADNLAGVTQAELQTFKYQTNVVAREVVASLVGENGAVLSGFKDALAMQNAERFGALKAQLDRQQSEIESSVRCVFWMGLAVVAVTVGLLVERFVR